MDFSQKSKNHITLNIKMKDVFVNIIIWIFMYMHFHFASSVETITSSLFRKIPVQEFRNVGVQGRLELKIDLIVNISGVLCST